MKVMLVGPSKPPTGGIQTVLKDTLSSSLTNRVDLVLFDNSKRTPPNRSLMQGIKSQLGIMREYVRAIRRENPDIVHIYSGGNRDFYRKSIDIFIARLLRRKVILHNHSGDFNNFWESRNFLGRFYVKFALKRCAKVLVTSQWWKDYHSKFVHADRISVAYNGVKAGTYEHNTNYQRARHVLTVPRNKVMVLMMGVIGRRKGAYDIVQAASLAAKMDNSLLFVLIGPDEDVAPGATEELKTIRNEARLEDFVQFRGPADERQRYLYYAAADIFLLPSYAENSPMTIIEAMASSLPVISTRVGAIPEMVEHDKTGLLIQPGRPGEIAEAVVNLSKDLHRRKEMGLAGFKKFRHMFDMERVVAPALWQVYKGLLPEYDKGKHEPQRPGPEDDEIQMPEPQRQESRQRGPERQENKRHDDARRDAQRRDSRRGRSGHRRDDEFVSDDVETPDAAEPSRERPADREPRRGFRDRRSRRRFDDEFVTDADIDEVVSEEAKAEKAGEADAEAEMIFKDDDGGDDAEGQETDGEETEVEEADAEDLGGEERDADHTTLEEAEEEEIADDDAGVEQEHAGGEEAHAEHARGEDERPAEKAAEKAKPVSEEKPAKGIKKQGEDERDLGQEAADRIDER